MIQSEFLGYVTPVVRLPTDIEQSEADASEFVDVSDAGSPSGSLSGDLVDLSVPQPIAHVPIAPPDEWTQRIERLQQENNKLRQDHLKIVEQLQAHIMDLENALATKDSELMQEKKLHEDLMHQTLAAEKNEDAESKPTEFS